MSSSVAPLGTERTSAKPADIKPANIKPVDIKSADTKPASRAAAGVTTSNVAAVSIIADSAVKLSDLRSLLKPDHAPSTTLLGQRLAPVTGADVVVIAADLRLVGNITAIKALAPAIAAARRRIMLIDEISHLYVAQAHALGATHVRPYPINRKRLLALLADPTTATEVKPADTAAKLAPASVAPLTAAESNAKGAAQQGADAIKSMFATALSGGAVDIDGVERAGKDIAASVMRNGLTNWLTAVRRHHEGTYQHCLLVCGVVTGFGLKLGVSSGDLKRLYLAAMFHDIGKATVPLAILDKPGALTSDERRVIQTHSSAGYDLLVKSVGLSDEVRDAVRHHHEYLDGSGYPDGLSGTAVSDLVRILTISDIFSALIEQRHYKPALPREQAYDMVCKMDGKLERALVTAFREVALAH